MLEQGTYLLAGVGFNLHNEPTITFQKGEELIDIQPLGYTLRFTVDTTQRFCTGWRDLTTSERFVCPQKLTISGKFQQCSVCQNRTGFNPAFYNTVHISSQQEARNQEPHFVYLAYFGSFPLKVGISYAKRGISRLLEQGARSALVLDTFPSATIARQYEAQIANLPNIGETVHIRKKQQLLQQPYDPEQADKILKATRDSIEQQFSVAFTRENEILSLDHYYFPNDKPLLEQALDCSEQNALAGHVFGMLGSLIFCHYQDETIYLPMKQFVGHMITFSKEATLTLPTRQISLF